MGTANCALGAGALAAGGASGTKSGCGLEGRAWLSACAEAAAFAFFANEVARTPSARRDSCVSCMIGRFRPSRLLFCIGSATVGRFRKSTRTAGSSANAAVLANGSSARLDILPHLPRQFVAASANPTPISKRTEHGAQIRGVATAGGQAQIVPIGIPRVRAATNSPACGLAARAASQVVRILVRISVGRPVVQHRLGVRPHTITPGSRGRHFASVDTADESGGFVIRRR